MNRAPTFEEASFICISSIIEKSLMDYLGLRRNGSCNAEDG
jgi:hypothetical protein